MIKELVIQEAKLIRKHATTEELDKISVESLDGHYEHTCVYGLMTGSCFGLRATELLNKCAKPYLIDLGGRKRSQSILFTRGHSRDFSPIEAYIFRKTSKKKPLVEYLRGERKTLTVKDL